MKRQGTLQLRIVEPPNKKCRLAEGQGHPAGVETLLIGDCSLAEKVRRSSYVGARYLVPAKLLSDAVVEQMRTELTYRPKNPDAAYNASKKRKEGVCYLKIEKGVLPGGHDAYALPRDYGRRRIGMPPKENDLRAEGDDLDAERCHFAGKLRQPDAEHPHWPNQVLACDSVMKHVRGTNGGFVKLPCGYGKTICMVYLVTQFRRKTLVITSTEPQQKEARESFAAFAPHLRVGYIQQELCDLDDDDVDVIIASIQTLQSPHRTFGLADFVRFGVCFVDEAHHLAATTYCDVLQRLVAAKYIIGLSATPRRQDGRTQALFDLVGPILYEEVRPPQTTTDYVAIRLLQQDRWNLKGQTMYDKKTPDRVNMLSDLAACAPRSAVAAELLASLLYQRTPNLERLGQWLANPHPLHCTGWSTKRPRKIMVLSHRLLLLDQVRSLLLDSFSHLHWCCLLDRIYLGLPSEAHVEAALAHPAKAMQMIRAPPPGAVLIGQLKGGGQKRAKQLVGSMLSKMNVVLAIDELGGESFNVPEMDTQLLLTPSIDMEQRHGRVQRGEAVNSPLIIDLIDTYCPLFNGMGQARMSEARCKGYNTKEVTWTASSLDNVAPSQGQPSEPPRVAYLPYKAQALEAAWKAELGGEDAP